jgi:hypothetical protein
MSTLTVATAEGNAWLQTRFLNLPCWLALHSADPTALGDPATEFAGGGYERQRITFGSPAGKAVTNNNNITFSGLPSGEVNFLAVWASLSGGAMRCSWPIAAITVVASNQLLVAVGDIAIQL